MYSKFHQQYCEQYLNAQFQTVLDYLLPFSGTELNPDLFSTEDILHMQDVQWWFGLVWVLFVICLSGYFLLHLFTNTNQAERRELRTEATSKTGSPTSILKNSSPIKLFALGFLAIIIAWALLDFNSFFVAFHRVVFPNNEYWSLDPRTSNLIKFLPWQIFAELLALWIVIAISSMKLLGTVNNRLKFCHQVPNFTAQ